MHHGEYMRVNAFCMAHYAAMEEFAGRQLPRPAMGENLSLDGVTDADIRVGDVLRSPGGALMHVTQPREPCSNVPRFLGVPGMLKWLVAQPITGFYLRVLTPGDVAPGDELEFVEHGPAKWTIERLNKAMYQEIADAEQVTHLQGLTPLSPRWKASLEKQADRHQANAARRTQTPS
jgi:MOSC domain-containing protein YiiM